MKNKLQNRLMLWTAFALLFTACEEVNILEDLAGEVSGRPVVTIGNGNRIIITRNTTWTKNNTYLLNGEVVVSGAVLTIQPGTLIRGVKDSNPDDQVILNSVLVIDKDAQIIAQGQPNNPIIFTSDQAPEQRNPGDWGGVVILGLDVVNQGTSLVEGLESLLTFGDNGDSRPQGSGILQYVRIEFSGTILQDGDETNGLTLVGVGTNTTIDHIQVSRSNDDGFEFFGGSVNAKFLISWQTRDDDFDSDFGHTGVVQYATSRRSNEFVSTESNGIETDNDGSGSNASPETNTLFANVTFIGPSELNGDGSEIDLTTPGVFSNGLLVRRNSASNLLNSIITGWPVGVEMRDILTADNYTLAPNSLKLEGLSVGLPRNGRISIRTANMPPVISNEVVIRYTNIGGNTVNTATSMCNLTCVVGLKDAAFATGQSAPNGTNPSGKPDLTLKAGSINLTNSETLSANAIARGLVQENFRGAFDQDGMVNGGNWNFHDEWIEFDPQGVKTNNKILIL